MSITVSYTTCSSLSNSVIQSKIDYINRIGSLLDDTIAKVKNNYQTHFNSLLRNIIKIYKASNTLTSSIIIVYNLAVENKVIFLLCSIVISYHMNLFSLLIYFITKYQRHVVTLVYHLLLELSYLISQFSLCFARCTTMKKRKKRTKKRQM